MQGFRNPHSRCYHRAILHVLNPVQCSIAPGFGQAQFFPQPPALLSSARDAHALLNTNTEVQKGLGIIFSLIFQRKVGRVYLCMMYYILQLFDL